MARGPRARPRRPPRATSPERGWFASFCAALRTAMAQYRAERPDDYERMVHSASMDTDGQVVRMLRHLGLHTPAFESNVLRAVRYVWGRAVSTLPLLGDPGREGLRNPAVVFHRLRHDPDRGTVIDDLVAIKAAYVAHVLRSPLQAARDLREVCGVLTCWAPRAPGHRMNSIGYCAQHWGLALLNGLRHAPGSFCDACRLWNLLCLRDTCADAGHRHNAVCTLTVPLVDREAGRINATLQRFCAAGFRRPRDRPPVLAARVSYLDAEGRSRLVPPLSWVYMGRNGLAKAWVRIVRTNLRTGSPRVVDTLEEFRDVEARLLRERRGPIFPCQEEDIPEGPQWTD